MLDMKFVRENLDAVRTMLKNRCNALDLSSFTELDERRRAILQDVEEKKARRNAVSKEIGVRKKAGESADAAVAEMRELGDEIAALDEDLRDVELKLRELLLQIPNMPKADVPIGADETENPEVRRWGTPRTFDFEPQAHWDIGEKLGVLDAERAAKVTGARFMFYKGLGARLERACINFMMDLHAEKHGYTEMLAPYIVNEDSMIGTGQLPKFAEDMFKLDGLDYYLVPTAEVPTTNYHRDEILEAEQLPEYYTSYTGVFSCRGRQRGPRYARTHSPAPVQQSRADQICHAGGRAGTSSSDGGGSRGCAQNTRAPVPRHSALHGRYELYLGEDLRPRGMDAGTE